MVEVQTQDNKTVAVQDKPKKATLGELMLTEREARTKPIKEIVDNFVKLMVSKTQNILNRVEIGNLVPNVTLGKQQDRNHGRG